MIRCKRTHRMFWLASSFTFLLPVRALSAGPVEIVGWSSQLVKQHPYPYATGLLELHEYRGDLLMVGRVYAALPGAAANQLRHEYGALLFRDGVVLPLLSDRTLFGNNGTIRAAYVDADRLYLAGGFELAAGDTVSNVIAIDPLSPNPIDRLGDGVEFVVGALGMFQSQLVAGAVLRTRTAGSDFLRIWTGSQWNAIDMPPEIDAAAVRSLLEWNGELWVGGMFLAAGESPDEGRSVAIWNGTDWSWPGNGLRSDSEARQQRLPDGLQGVCDLTLYAGAVHAAGSFHDESGGIWGAARFVNGVWEGLPVRETDFRQMLDFEGSLVFLGQGEHVLADASTTHSVCAWDGSQWAPLPGFERPVIDPAAVSYAGLVFEGALTLSDDTGYTWGSDAENGLLRLEGDHWIDPWDRGGTDGPVSALLADGDGVVVAGQFEYAGGVLSPMVARWGGSDFTPMSAGLVEPAEPVPGSGQLLARYRGDVILAGGAFGLQGLGGQNIARWDGASWQPLSAGLQNEAGEFVWISALLVFEDMLLAGGIFDRSGATEMLGLAVWDGQAWSAWPTPFQATAIPNVWWPTPFVSSLAELNGELWVGGYGLSVDGTTVRSLARWSQGQWLFEDVEAPLGVMKLATAGDHLLAGIYNYETSNHVPGFSVVRPGSIVPYGTKPPFSSAPRLDGQAQIGAEHWYLVHHRAYRYDGNLFEAVPGLPGNVMAAIAIRDHLYVGGAFAPNLDVPSEHFAIAELSESVPAFAVTLALLKDGDKWSLHSRWPSYRSVERIALEERAESRSWHVREIRQLEPSAQQATFEIQVLDAQLRHYRVVVGAGGERIVSNEIEHASDNGSGGVPSVSFLRAVRPNPFNPSTRAEFALSRAGAVQAEIYALDGRRILRRSLGWLAAGAQSWIWDGSDGDGSSVASGSYVLRILAPDRTLSTRVLLLK